MPDDLINRQSLPLVLVHHEREQFFAFAADFVPLGALEHLLIPRLAAQHRLVVTFSLTGYVVQEQVDENTHILNVVGFCQSCLIINLSRNFLCQNEKTWGAFAIWLSQCDCFFKATEFYIETFGAFFSNDCLCWNVTMFYSKLVKVFYGLKYLLCTLFDFWFLEVVLAKFLDTIFETGAFGTFDDQIITMPLRKGIH